MQQDAPSTSSVHTPAFCALQLCIELPVLRVCSAVGVPDQPNGYFCQVHGFRVALWMLCIESRPAVQTPHQFRRDTAAYSAMLLLATLPLC
jgi:hypothetical protein